jgi:predicted transcriptional regulator
MEWKEAPMAEAKPESIFDTPDDEAADAAADAAAEAEIDAGKGVPHARVRAWLESWGKPDELPCPLPPK